MKSQIGYGFSHNDVVKSSQKNISRDPRLGVSVIDSSISQGERVGRGKVIEQINGKKTDDYIDKLAKKYLEKSYLYSFYCRRNAITTTCLAQSKRKRESNEISKVFLFICAYIDTFAYTEK